MRDSPVTSHARSPTLFFDDSNREDTLARNCANSDKMTVPVPRKRCISIQKHTRITSEQILTTLEKKMTPKLILLLRKRSLRSKWRTIIQEVVRNDFIDNRCEMLGLKDPK